MYIEPRSGCSAYNLNDKLFIFGGFYEREKSYMKLQNDITSLDFSNFHVQILRENKVECAQIKNIYSA
jgi:hypothetical protein